MNNTYFLIPLDRLPASPPYPVWFVTWSRHTRSYSWSRERERDAGESRTWAVGVSAGVPAGATVLGTGGKDLPPPAAARINTFEAGTPEDFLASFTMWMDGRDV